ncbi:ABC transporter permease [Laceyella sacchari]|uniref:ABC transporter permease n=1 Tax=Laceyella sacchari TaxID=37482 RepID=A0ABY5U4V6_LACSH|nr:ABC transporter permease [Laceyella sacchari]UWE04664.1 ABC transporter permease [Laceyella sacchari]
MNRLETSTLFWSRMRSSWTKALRLIRIIAGGGGTPIILGITIIAFSFGYNQLLAWLPESFPMAHVLAVIIGLFLTHQRIRTWIKPTDAVFLLSLEPQMGKYFRASLLYTGAVKLLHLGVIMGILYPLYRANLGTLGTYVVACFLLAGVLLLNLVQEWQATRLTVNSDTSDLRLWKICRFALNLMLAYDILASEWELMLMTLTALAVWCWRGVQLIPQAPYPWQHLSRLEQETLARYYAIANWFVDMPRYKRPLRQRKWLIRLVNRLIRDDAVYPYLYWRTLVRQSDLLAIFTRLLVWVLLLSFCVPHPWVVTLLTLLGNWMFTVQLRNIEHAAHYPVLFKLMPRPAWERSQALQQITRLLSTAFASLIALVGLLVGWLDGTGLVIYLIINGVAILFFSRTKR